MAKFNTKPTIKTTNQSGHVAYSMQDKDRLAMAVLTSFFGEPKFYNSTDNDIIELTKRIAPKDPTFIRNLAIFARREFGMRSISHVLTAILANTVEGKPFIREMMPKVVVRADDITEILSAYLHFFSKPIPNSLKKGIADAFGRLDEYQLQKYAGTRNALKMRDIPRLVHPKPKDAEQSALWKRLLDDTLATPFTWETELSAKGNTKEVWEGLIESGKVGYLALIRNLRNIINAQPDNINTVYETLADPEKIRRSRMFPFQFLSAYKELQQVSGASSKVFDTLEAAIDISVENMPKLPGKTVIVVDVSGSMSSAVSAKSKMTCAEIGLMLGVMATRLCEDSIFLTFDTRLYKPTVSTKGGILSQVRNIPVHGGGTNMSLPFQWLIQEKIRTDRVIVLSDNEVNGGSTWYSNKTVQSLADEYRAAIGADVWVHGVDLQGYGTQQFHGSKANLIAGWSEKILEFILLAEQGIDTLVKRIENYQGGVANV